MKKIITYIVLMFVAIACYGQNMESEQISSDNYTSSPGTNLPVYYGHYNLLWNDVDWLYDNLGTVDELVADSATIDSLHAKDAAVDSVFQFINLGDTGASSNKQLYNIILDDGDTTLWIYKAHGWEAINK